MLHGQNMNLPQPEGRLGPLIAAGLLSWAVRAARLEAEASVFGGVGVGREASLQGPCLHLLC